jgi:hypothetical protein
MAQAVSRRLLISKERFRSQVTPCRICDRRYGIGIDNSPENSAVPYTNYCISPSPMLHDFSNSASFSYTLQTLRTCKLKLSLSTLQRMNEWRRNSIQSYCKPQAAVVLPLSNTPPSAH